MVGDRIEHAGVEPVNLGFRGVVGVEIADFEVDDGESLVALSDDVAVVGTGGEGGGDFGEGGGINERFEAAEGIGGGFVVRREAALVDEEPVIDGVGKIIVVVVMSEGDGEVGVAGGGGEDGAIRFAVAVSAKFADEAGIGGLGQGEIEEVATLAGESFDLVEEYTGDLAAGNIDAAQMVIFEHEELVGGVVDEFDLVEIKAKGAGEIEATVGIFEVDEEPFAGVGSINSGKYGVAAGVPSQRSDTAGKLLLFDAR